MSKTRKNWLGFKLILVILIITISETILKYFDPVMSASFAVNQLEDSYTANAGLNMYQDFKSNFWMIYIATPLVIFFTDIYKLLFKKKEGK